MNNPIAPLLLAALATVAPGAEVFRVAATGGTHASLQAAIDACRADCRIEMTDSIYTFSEPVSIRGKSSIEIVGSRADGSRPVLRLDASARTLEAIPDLDGFRPVRTRGIAWGPTAPDTVRDADGTFEVRDLAPVLATFGFAPRFLLAAGRSAEGAADPTRPRGWMTAPFSTPHAVARGSAGLEVVTHARAALLQVDSSRGIRVRGLDFDGQGPIELLIHKLWGPDLYSEVGGVAAISLHHSLRAEVSGCEFRGWQAGVRSVDNNRGGLVTDLMSNGDEALSSALNLAPLSNPGAMGGHRIEGNLAHGNLVFVDLSNSWDLASTIRHNRVWSNGRSRVGTAAAWNTAYDTDAIWWGFFGGFVRLSDVLYSTPLLQGNTLVRNTLDVSHFGYRASAATLFLDNISVRRDQQRDWRELSNQGGVNVRNNWIAATREATFAAIRPDSLVPFCDDPACEPFTPAWGAASVDRLVVGGGVFGDDLGAIPRTRRSHEAIDLQDQTLGFVVRAGNIWKVVLPVPVSAPAGITDLRLFHALAQELSASDQVQLLTANPNTPLPTLLEAPLARGLNFLAFDLPAAPQDSIWRVELAAAGINSATGETVRSRLGTWLVRPMGHQLRVTSSKVAAAPGERVEFTVTAVDSTGAGIALDATPRLNAPGWTLEAAPPAVASRAAVPAPLRFSATAPASSGTEPIVFWTKESGRYAATAGATYVQVGTSSSAVTDRAASGAGWRIARFDRGTGRIRIAGAAPRDLASARLHDAAGAARPLAIADPQGELVVPRGLAGTWFLRIADRSVPIVLLP